MKWSEEATFRSGVLRQQVETECLPVGEMASGFEVVFLAVVRCRSKGENVLKDDVSLKRLKERASSSVGSRQCV